MRISWYNKSIHGLQTAGIDSASSKLKKLETRELFPGSGDHDCLGLILASSRNIWPKFIEYCYYKGSTWLFETDHPFQDFVDENVQLTLRQAGIKVRLSHEPSYLSSGSLAWVKYPHEMENVVDFLRLPVCAGMCSFNHDAHLVHTENHGAWISMRALIVFNKDAELSMSTDFCTPAPHADMPLLLTPKPSSVEVVKAVEAALKASSISPSHADVKDSWKLWVASPLIITMSSSNTWINAIIAGVAGAAAVYVAFQFRNSKKSHHIDYINDEKSHPTKKKESYNISKGRQVSGGGAPCANCVCCESSISPPKLDTATVVPRIAEELANPVANLNSLIVTTAYVDACMESKGDANVLIKSEPLIVLLAKLKDADASGELIEKLSSVPDCNVNATDKKGISALSWSSLLGNKRAVGALCERASVNLAEMDTGNTALHCEELITIQ
eukprot:UC4_evm6s1335